MLFAFACKGVTILLVPRKGGVAADYTPSSAEIDAALLARREMHALAECDARHGRRYSIKTEKKKR